MNIWTDSKYAFSVVHAHGAICKERGLLTAQGNEIKNAEQILALQSIWKPSEAAIMHCRGHQKWKASLHLGNCFADETMSQGWPHDVHGTLVQNASRGLSKNNYWISLHLPPLDRSSNWLLISILMEANPTERWEKVSETLLLPISLRA